MAERITGYTGLAGLFAHPVHHSSSPMMHNEAFAKLGLDYAYLGFDVDNDNLVFFQVSLHLYSSFFIYL